MHSIEPRGVSWWGSAGRGRGGGGEKCQQRCPGSGSESGALRTGALSETERMDRAFHKEETESKGPRDCKTHGLSYWKRQEARGTRCSQSLELNPQGLP